MNNWPPVWMSTRIAGDNKPIGEAGVLEKVIINELLVERRLLLIIRHQGEQYTGSLIFDDSRMSNQIHILLNSKVGSSIQEISDLDLSFLL